MLERIDARANTIGGGLTIRRALPNTRRRMVGAWCFLDHAGPLQFPPGEGLRVGPHPHIGLQTFTWLIEGAVVHRDSLGNEQLITPGQVNLMTAGQRDLPFRRQRRATGTASQPTARNACTRCSYGSRSPMRSATARPPSATTRSCR